MGPGTAPGNCGENSVGCGPVGTGMAGTPAIPGAPKGPCPAPARPGPMAWIAATPAGNWARPGLAAAAPVCGPNPAKGCPCPNPPRACTAARPEAEALHRGLADVDPLSHHRRKRLRQKPGIAPMEREDLHYLPGAGGSLVQLPDQVFDLSEHRVGSGDDQRVGARVDADRHSRHVLGLSSQPAAPARAAEHRQPLHRFRRPLERPVLKGPLGHPRRQPGTTARAADHPIRIDLPDDIGHVLGRSVLHRDDPWSRRDHDFLRGLPPVEDPEEFFDPVGIGRIGLHDQGVQPRLGSDPRGFAPPGAVQARRRRRRPPPAFRRRRRPWRVGDKRP